MPAVGRLDVSQTLEPPPYGKAATTFAAYTKQAPQPSGQLGTADKIFDFAVNRVLGLLFPMPDAYDAARWVHGKINETSPSGEHLTGSAQRTAVDPIALSTGRPRRSAGTGVAPPDTPRGTPAERAVRRHPFADWMPNMQLYKDIFSPGQRAAKPAAIKA